MNTLIINGAVKENGECKKLIEMFNKDLNAEVIDIYKQNLSPCQDCGKCQATGACIIDDNMKDIYEKTINADVIVFASPIYYSSMTGVMMNFLSRYQLFYLSEKKCKNKKAALLLTGGGATKRLDLIEHQLKLVLRIINAKYEGLVAYINTDNQSITGSTDTIKKLDNLKKRLFDQAL